MSGPDSASADTISCHGRVATIVGTPDADTLTGTEGPDVIFARAGDDIIRGLGGDDVICGRLGDDVIDGGEGDDQIWADAGDDRVTGGLGADTLKGGGGDDVLDGQDGADLLNGGNGRDQCWNSPRPRRCENEFEPIGLPLNDYSLADLGVVDLDDDGALDVFGLNHNSPDTVLRAGADRAFENVTSAWGLDQVPTFPGLENSAAIPRLRGDGLHVVLVQNRIRLHHLGAADALPAMGSLQLFGKTRVTEKSRSTARLTETVTPRGLISTQVDFEIAPDGYLVIDPYYLGGPVSVAVSAPSNPRSIFVGARRAHPQADTFDFQLRDRHGAAWTRSEFGGLGEVAIFGGGLKGDMAKFDAVRGDEYFTDAGGRFQDVTAQRSLEKDNCSSRQTAWVDADQDGRLDLYVSCEFRQGNRLHHQNPDGTFTEIASRIGLALSSAGPFRWIDLDLDGTSELVTASADGVLVSTWTGVEYVSRIISDPVIGARPMSVADYDADGDLDAVLASTSSSLLLRNDGGDLTVVPVAEVGLPDSMLEAVFVDEDNDGDADLSVTPGGLFHQGDDGTFDRVDLYAPDTGTLVDSLTTWFDVDNDGDRDRLHAVVTSKPVISSQWSANLLENKFGSNHWLEIDLRGPQGNRSAIGALVSVETSRGNQVEQVGTSSEGSRYSQGHHRLYFGLGDGEVVDVTVQWPDGSATALEDVAADQILRPSYS